MGYGWGWGTGMASKGSGSGTSLPRKVKAPIAFGPGELGDKDAL